MTWTKAVVILYGLITLAMGIQGYMAGSQMSLMAGGTLGVLVIGSGLLALKKPRVGHICALVFTLILTINWVMRYMKSETKAFYPAMFGIILGVLVIASLLGGHMMANKGKSAPAAE